ncbi:SDR family oxidoreductase [Brachybacterium saurashtrense]|uniref:SDR family NAD(P)-dependent oxidoreductase n=1 Tax=Brachybacterium saurashtrense TaxID=556288 RepID=A0A345YR39_9MICO|nr:SDR family oxidoreductase [Brachybacterium saurashtrense]AXK46391.1 SDR family NAD(P)-dependent oxidoreductase [Brachybacterium saurashtrense]RRR24132.1 SDR family NAD(P)-dependent oxidoreductase [Brachybacterium saurashtrense]
MRIAVTGASGRIGGEVARLLHGIPGITLRLVGRSAARLPRLEGAETALASFDDAEACREAFTGADAVLLVSAGEAADRLDQHRTAIAALAAAEVGHVVYTSFLGASVDAAFTLARDHAATEEMLRDAGPAWTALRDSFYADVLLDFAGDDRVIRGPGGTGRCAFVARRDVAEVAARILRDPAPYAGRVLDLTGPVAVSLAEAALLMTRARGEEYEYVDETMAEARASRAPYGAPEWQVEAWISTYTAIRDGELDVVGDGVAEVLGRAPRTLEETVAAPL